MNGEDEFEQRLQRVARRPVPLAWRDEILATAAADARSRGLGQESREGSPPYVGAYTSLLGSLNSLLSKVLWPHPRAWAGLAAVWLVILGLNYATRDPSTRHYARYTAPPSPEMREILRQQKQLLAELVGPIGKPQTQPPQPAAPQPRSQRREEFLNA
jgi:hypothetical protein